MKHTLMIFLAIFCVGILSAQQTATCIKGRVINSENKRPVVGIIVSIDNNATQTDNNGLFIICNVSPGKNIVKLNSVDIASKSIVTNAVANTTTDLGEIVVTKLTTKDDISLIGVIDESMVDDDVESSSQEISSKVILSNDPYLNKVSYQLSPLRFRVRGYESKYESKYINGVNFSDQYRGQFSYSSIGALNDVTRNGDVINYNAPSSFGYGTIGGMENINMKASSYSAGNKASIAYTNRNYYLRGMFTHSTGLLKNGWAFTASVGGRYSDEGAIDGTFYKNIAYALSAEKQWNNGKQSLSIVTFGSPVNRGQQGASYQIVYDLTGNNLYNPNWGYQNGKKRNAKTVTSFDPTVIISHTWKINDKNTLTTGIGSHYGKYGNTSLNWYNAPDPRPDYYRNLPSYYSSEAMIEQISDLWKSGNTAYTQINWDKMYLANAQQEDGSAQYMVENRHSDLFEATFNSTINSRINEHNIITAGIEARGSLSQQYKTVDDLLGAKYVLDYDKFAEQDFQGDMNKAQNDLNRPDRKVYKNGIFGYDFDINIMKAGAWINNQYNYNKIDFYYGLKCDYTRFYRDGKMKNGRYPDNSFGKGDEHNFCDINAKAGITYKITGRHFLTANISYGTYAPLAYDAYVSPRISDKSVKGLENERIFSADLNYIFSLPSLNGRISVFQTNFYDQVERSSYYDETQSTFINHVLNGIYKIHRGVELGTTYKYNNQLSFDLAGTISECFYNNNPMGTINSENGKIDNLQEKVYMKNVYVGGTPQFAGTFGIRYFINYWFLGANLNGYGRNYIDVAPLRRIASNYTSVNNSETLEAYRILTHQERFEPGYTVDLSIGKIVYLSRKQSLNLNITVNNLLNKEDVCTGGYEQGRTNINYPNRFASKYYYMQGINCFINLGYRF